MPTEGPPLELLLHRLTVCPAEFLEETAAGDAGRHVAVALIFDHLRSVDAGSPPELETRLAATLEKMSRERLRLLAIACWMLHDSWFLARPELSAAMRTLLRSKELAQLSELVKPEKLLNDPDRREELARICLDGLGLRPQGESELQAADRRMALDSVERNRVLRATAAAERRARQIREQMARAAAQDAASRYGE